MTQKPAPANLMAGFKNNFGEIIDLVSEASDKTGPWVTDRIGKMSKKAQDEIYGRFNEAFNDGAKDAAAGRKFYESSLDFPALAQKTTQVADDIELADKINKQFEENAPIKTIYGQYKQLSTSARKEIEKHLKTTAEKTPPKDLQNALITVFNGMGRLESETKQSNTSSSSSKTSSSSRASSSSSSSSASSKTPSKPAHSDRAAELDEDPELAKIATDLQKPEIQEQIAILISFFAKTVKKDIDLANAHAAILAEPKTNGTETSEGTQARHDGIPKLYQKFSQPAKCMIEKILIEQSKGSMKTYISAEGAYFDDLRKAIREFFDVYVNGSVDPGWILKKWEFDEEEALKIQFYHRTCADFYHILPHFKDDKPVIAAKEIEKLAKTAFSKLTIKQMQAYVPLFLEVSKMPYKQAHNVVCKENDRLMSSLMIICDPTYDRKSAFDIYERLPPTVKKELQAYLDVNYDKVTFKKASTAERNEAVKAYIKALVGAQMVKQEKAEALQTATLKFALFCLEDCQILRRNASFLKTAEAKHNQDKAQVLKIFDSLSPFAKLLVEQQFIRDCPGGVSEAKTKADTVRALIAEGEPDFVKDAMFNLFDKINSNLIGFSITHGMKLENLGTAEKLLLQAYLGYPRHITFAFLQSHPSGSPQDLVNYLSKNMETLHSTVIKEFQGTVIELATQKGQYEQLFAKFTEKAGTIKLPENTAAEGLKEFLFTERVFTKRDFYAEIMAFEEKANEILDQ
jgi:hypothetical protein